MSDSSALVAVNLLKEMKHLKYREESKNERYADCPVCKEGVVMLSRERNTFILREFCYCFLCGQRFVVDDIEEIRSKDWVSGVEKGVAIDIHSVGLDRSGGNGS